MKETIWFLKLWYLNNVITAGFSVKPSYRARSPPGFNFCCQVFDAARLYSKLTHFSAHLCQMTRWNCPFLTRQQAMKLAHKHSRNCSQSSMLEPTNAPMGNNTLTLAQRLMPSHPHHPLMCHQHHLLHHKSRKVHSNQGFSLF
jgi:hypothetical protein